MLRLDSRSIKIPERTSELSVEFLKRNERNFSLRPRGIGVSARIDSGKRGEAVLVDSFVGTYGIPASAEGRGQAAEWKWEEREQIASSGTQERLKMFARLRMFSVGYITIMLLVGSILQGVFH